MDSPTQQRLSIKQPPPKGVICTHPLSPVITYIYNDKEPDNLISINLNDNENTKNINLTHNTYLRENYQRNIIREGISEASPEDFIIIGDIDEIPNLNNLNFEKNKKQIMIFKQKMFYYKLNLLYKELIWNGTKACIKQKLNTQQWL